MTACSAVESSLVLVKQLWSSWLAVAICDKDCYQIGIWINWEFMTFLEVVQDASMITAYELKLNDKR